MKESHRSTRGDINRVEKKKSPRSKEMLLIGFRVPFGWVWFGFGERETSQSRRLRERKEQNTYIQFIRSSVTVFCCCSSCCSSCR